MWPENGGMRGSIEAIKMEEDDHEPRNERKEEETVSPIERRETLPCQHANLTQLGLCWTSNPQKHKAMNMCCVKLLCLW